jgi:hypothetical protein
MMYNASGNTSDTKLITGTGGAGDGSNKYVMSYNNLESLKMGPASSYQPSQGGGGGYGPANNQSADHDEYSNDEFEGDGGRNVYN